MGCPVNPLIGTQVMKGTIKDVISNLPISNVRISSKPGSLVVYSDTLGNFTMTGLSAGVTYIFTFSKSGYFTIELSQKITTGDTATVSLQMGIAFYRFNSLAVHEYFNDNSLSAVNLFSGFVIPELNGNEKDIQMRDSAGLSQNFLFRSGDLALDNPGLKTLFTEPLMNGRDFTKQEFDTLSKLYPVTGLLDPVLDFPRNNTWFYTTNLTGLHHIYGFYLKGRYDLNGWKRVYGMLYINSINVVGTEKQFNIDVKINRAGENDFNLYP